MSPTILPTHHCFDDALDRLAALAYRVAHHRLALVHAICLMPDGQPDAGTRFVHAWVEDDDVVWDAGLLDGQHIAFAVDRAEYHAQMRIETMTRYTVEQAWRANKRTQTYGPWRPEYVALVRARDDDGVP